MYLTAIFKINIIIILIFLCNIQQSSKCSTVMYFTFNGFPSHLWSHSKKDSQCTSELCCTIPSTRHEYSEEKKRNSKQGRDNNKYNCHSRF